MRRERFAIVAAASASLAVSSLNDSDLAPVSSTYSTCASFSAFSSASMDCSSVSRSALYSSPFLFLISSRAVSKSFCARAFDSALAFHGVDELEHLVAPLSVRGVDAVALVLEFSRQRSEVAAELVVQVADQSVLEVGEGVQLRGVRAEGGAVLLLGDVELARQLLDLRILPVAEVFVRLRQHLDVSEQLFRFDLAHDLEPVVLDPAAAHL